jgi:hypothetical protein
VVQVTLAALEGAVEISGMTREPANFALDRRVLDIVDRKAGADALEQVTSGGRGNRSADAADERRARLGLCIQRLDGSFDLLGARDADLGFVQLRDRRVELDGFDAVFIRQVLVYLLRVVA